MIYTKNVVVYGPPGRGKSFVGELVVLYGIALGLNVLSTSLVGVWVNDLGGIRMHQLFQLPTGGYANASPFCMAEGVMQKLRNKTVLLHAILTLDILFLDKAGQTSNEQLATIDIILCKERRSQIPFGGVLIIGTMDPTQLQPIDQLPFLTSSLMMTCFSMIELQHSVRAHGDIEYQRLQAITRMNPFAIVNDNVIKQEFMSLVGEYLLMFQIGTMP
jgi:hypothetical protein